MDGKAFHVISVYIEPFHVHLQGSMSLVAGVSVHLEPKPG